MLNLPDRPIEQDNLLGQLLVNSNTANDLCWSLMDKVDPGSKINDKSLLQVFCEQRRGERKVWTDLSFETDPLPLGANEPWPDPRKRANDKDSTGWPTPEMWVAAHLICNGPDPFSWKSEKDGKDVLDFVIQWGNPLLLDQLLRHPSAPGVEVLSRRTTTRANTPWIHAMASMELNQMVAVLLHHRFPVNQLDSKGATPLHHAASAAVASVLLSHGADPFALDKAGRSIHQSWVGGVYKSPVANFSQDHDLFNKFNALDRAAIEQDPARAKEYTVPAIFAAMTACKNSHLLTEACTRHELPLDQWVQIEGNSEQSILHAMAVGALRKKKSPLVASVCRLVGEVPEEALEHVSLRNVPDLAFFWLCASRYGDTASDGAPYKVKIIDRLSKDGDPIRAQSKLWQAAFHLDGAKPFKGNKIDEAIRTAWSNEISDIAREFAANPVLKPQIHRVDAIMKDPGLLAHLARMPMGVNAQSSFARVLEDAYKRDPEIGPHCLLAAVSMCRATHPKEQSENIVVLSVNKFLDAGIAWDAALPGAQEALNALLDRAKKSGDLGPVASRVQAHLLQTATPASSARPRQRF